ICSSTGSPAGVVGLWIEVSSAASGSTSWSATWSITALSLLSPVLAFGSAIEPSFAGRDAYGLTQIKFHRPIGRADRQSAGQSPHRLVDAGQSQRKHAVVDEGADHGDAGRAAPVFFRHGIEPHRLRVVVEDPAHPHRAGLVVPALDTAARPVNLVG